MVIDLDFYEYISSGLYYLLESLHTLMLIKCHTVIASYPEIRLNVDLNLIKCVFLFHLVW